jgi:hypothetical protein
MKCLNFLKEESICVFNEYLEINLNPYFHRRKASHKEWNTEPLWWKISLREEWVRTMIINCWTPVAHARNPSYSGGRDQDLKKTITKKDWWSDSRCRPWVQTPVAPKKNKNAGELMLGMQQKLASFSVSCKHPPCPLPWVSVSFSNWVGGIHSGFNEKTCGQVSCSTYRPAEFGGTECT